MTLSELVDHFRYVKPF